MEGELLNGLKRAGADVEGAIARFAGNRALYEKYLLKYPEDPTFDQLAEAVQAGDLSAAREAAHTLKGVSGNLGLVPLFDASVSLLESLRAGKLSRERFERLKEARAQMLKVILGDM